MSDDSKARLAQGFVGGALVVGALAVGFYSSRDPAPPPSAPPTAALPSPMAAPNLAPPPGPAAPPVPASPREAADLLFNEVMMASEQNDAVALAQALPGALAAYRALGPLDDDGTYHVALLELAGKKFPEARATCATVLAKNPNHLLALGVSMRAAARDGDSVSASDFAQRLLKAYDAEVSRPLPEYQDHGRMLPTYRAEAMAAAK